MTQEISPTSVCAQGKKQMQSVFTLTAGENHDSFFVYFLCFHISRNILIVLLLFIRQYEN